MNCGWCKGTNHTIRYCPEMGQMQERLDRYVGPRYQAHPMQPPVPEVRRIDILDDDLASVVWSQIGRITAQAPEFRGGEELPPGDLTAYGPALDQARRRCEHNNLDETLHSREWLCLDCTRHFTRADLRAIKGNDKWWLW